MYPASKTRYKHIARQGINLKYLPNDTHTNTLNKNKNNLQENSVEMSCKMLSHCL